MCYDFLQAAEVICYLQNKATKGGGYGLFEIRQIQTTLEVIVPSDNTCHAARIRKS